MIKCMILVLASFLIVLTQTAAAATKSQIGFNEEWVSGYLENIGEYCSDCPTNTLSEPYNTINNIIYNQAAAQHVGSFREIIPEALIEKDKANGYANIIKILQLYSGYNLHLTLVLGLPLAPGDSVTGSDYLVMPDSNAAWTTLKNTLSYSIGNLLNAMWNSPSISRTWMSTNLYVEGMNEFDALMDPNGSTAFSSPARAIDLTDGINYVINLYGISTYQTMPSIVGNYSGYAPGVDARVQFVSDYYAQGGIGFPNVHIYAPTNNPNTTYVDVLNAVRAEVQAVTAAMPARLKGLLFLSETGHADVTPPYCNADNGTYGDSIDPAQRAQEYEAIAADPVIVQDIAVLTFWRLMTLPPTQVPSAECESFFGVMDYKTLTYNSVGQNLFNYLNSK